MELVRRDGSRVWVEATAVVVQWEGTPATRVSLLDITERKRTEALLGERDSQLRHLADNLPGGVVYQVVRRPDGSNYFPYVSGGLSRTFGITPEAAMANAQAVYDRIVPEDLLRLRAAGDESLRTSSPFDVEIRLRTDSGEPRWLHVRGQPHRLADGSALWDAVAIDISAGKRALEAERQSAELRAVATLAAAAAHEINNPATVLVGHLELLQAEIGELPGTRQHFDRMRRALERILESVRQMQRITRLEPLTDLDTSGIATLDLRRSSASAPSEEPAGSEPGDDRPAPGDEQGSTP